MDIETIVAKVEAGESVTAEDAAALVRVIDRRCRGPLPAEAREIVSRLIADDDLAQARALDANARKPCGQDVNDLILAAPLDGEDHVVACPACGVAISYRAPRIAVG
jgi:hypothetical protein